MACAGTEMNPEGRGGEPPAGKTAAGQGGRAWWAADAVCLVHCCALAAHGPQSSSTAGGGRCRRAHLRVARRRAPALQRRAGTCGKRAWALHPSRRWAPGLRAVGCTGSAAGAESAADMPASASRPTSSGGSSRGAPGCGSGGGTGLALRLPRRLPLLLLRWRDRPRRGAGAGMVLPPSASAGAAAAGASPPGAGSAAPSLLPSMESSEGLTCRAEGWGRRAATVVSGWGKAGRWHRTPGVCPGARCHRRQFGASSAMQRIPSAHRGSIARGGLAPGAAGGGRRLLARSRPGGCPIRKPPGCYRRRRRPGD